MYEGQQKRDRLYPELMYLAMQMGLQLGAEYQKRYNKVVVAIINGSLTDKKNQKDVERWQSTARTSAFRQGVLTITDRAKAGVSYAADFPIDVNEMD